MPDVLINEFFEEAHEFINEGLSLNEGVLVVCTAGISRSATIVISYLIKTQKIRYEEAFSKVKEARALIKPNDGFVEILKRYSTVTLCDLCNLSKKTEWFD